MILVYIIANNPVEAEKICYYLLEKQLVYSVNIIPELKSMRRENDKIIEFRRTIILAKTKLALYSNIESEIRRLHETGPVIIFSMPLTQFSHELFQNIQDNTISEEP